jgi:hypothetical protein
MSAKHPHLRRYLASIEDHAKSNLRFSGGSKGKHKCCGGGTFETALPSRSRPRTYPPPFEIAPIFGSIMAIWRKAKDHYATASRMSSVVARKTLPLGRCRGSRRNTGCGLPDSSSLEPHNRTAVPVPVPVPVVVRVSVLPSAVTTLVTVWTTFPALVGLTLRV